MKTIFRKAKKNEVKEIYALIEDRVRWMDDKGIRQWNVTDYLNVYPLAYYENHLDSLYVLIDEDNHCIRSAAILLDEDERWHKKEPAFYIHNFVSDVNSKDAGKTFIENVEAYAIKKGISYLRLDSANDNEKLAHYYEKLGFMPCGTCNDGLYHGILREKMLKI